MRFVGGRSAGRFPSLLTLTVTSGAREGDASAEYYGGFRACSADCPGDCDGNGRVTIDELVRGIDIALGSPDLPCEGLDGNGDAAVSIGEIVAAVEGVLGECSIG